MKHILFAFLISMLCFPALLLDARAQGSVATDRAALVALYDATDGDNWTNNDNWKTSKPLRDWYGVQGYSDGRVLIVDLRENGLTGEIPSEIGNLLVLEWLQLGDNHLTGEIPSEIGNLSALEWLSLRSNHLTGEIPSEIGNLSALRGLRLWVNDLTGEIPPEIGNLSALTSLGLNNNALTGEIPSEIGKLSALESLNLGGNALTGEIPPEIGNLSALEWLDLYENDLTGEIPPEIGNLSVLRVLFLGKNDLTGEIPPEIGNLSALTTLILYYTDLTGEIPPEIGNLSALTSLDLWGNSLTGEIPSEIGNLSDLWLLSLGDNHLTGAIPETFSNLLNLESFHTKGNAELCLPASLVSWHAGIFNRDSISECSNAALSFTSPATFNALENQTSVGTVAASDSDAGDSVTGYAIHSGADSSMFSIVASTGVLTFVSPPNFEVPEDADTDGDYVVVVRATSGEGARVKTADQTITVTVTDRDEAPSVPVEPFVSSASVTSVTASWIAPANAGPPIVDYDYRYRATSQGPWTEVTNTTITALSVTIAGLVEDTEYEVQVRATNAEGTSGWSASGTGTPTGSTEAGAIANAPENLQATAGNAEVTLRWDAPLNDSGANITGYAYRYKESGGDFIVWTDIPDSGLGEANSRRYTVPGLTNGLEYVFYVRALNEYGGGLPAEVTVMLPANVRIESEELPSEAALWANYPNPFNPETTIRYALPQAGNVRLAVYDLLGHEVAILVDRSKPAGNHTARFDATGLPSGLYVYRLQAQDKIIVRTMMLVK